MRYKTELMKAILTNETAQRIIDYVSPIYGNSYVGLWLFQAIGTVLSEVCTIAEQLRVETNPATADLLLDLWEQQYGVATDRSLTKEQRRLRIISKTQSRRACNPARLGAAVSASLNGAKVEVTENAAQNKFVVTILEPVDSYLPAVAVIERMKPAHLIYELRITDYLVTNAELKVAVAMTHSEKFQVPVSRADDGVEPELYVLGETLVANNVDATDLPGARVEGETLIFY